MKSRYITVTAADLPLRTEVFQGRTHLVAPVVAMVEGVINAMNSGGPEFVPAQEFRKAPDGWNGRPIFVGHPLSSGHPVPGNTPKLLDQKAIGTIFNTKATKDQLTMEAWFDVTRVEELAPEILERLENHEPLEVSVGVFVDVSDKSGEFKGKIFSGEWHNLVPDHLAILPDQKGACSWSMGCGIRATLFRELIIKKEGDKYCLRSKETNQNLGCFDTREEAEQREREVQFFKSQRGGQQMCNPSETKSVMARMLSWFQKAETRSAELVDSDLRRALEEAISEKEERRVFVEAFKSEAQLVFYSILSSHEEEFLLPGFGTTFQRSFTQTDDRVSVGDDREEVTRKVDFITRAAAEGAPRSTSESQPAPKETRTMTRDKAKVEALIAASNGVFTDADQTFLETATDEQFARFETKFAADKKATEERVAADKVIEEKAAEEKKAAEVKAAEEKKAAEVKATAEGKEVTEEQYLAGAPAEIRDMLTEGLKLGRERKTATIKVLKDSGRCDLTDEQLKAMSQDDLDKLVKLANVRAAIDFTGQAPRIPDQPKDAAPAPPDMVGIIRAANEKK